MFKDAQVVRIPESLGAKFQPCGLLQTICAACTVHHGKEGMTRITFLVKKNQLIFPPPSLVF